MFIMKQTKVVRTMAKVIENPRQLILTHAREILSDQGYSQLTMRGVASACGIALGTIYNYFPNKEDLMVEMMSDYWKTFQLEVEGILGSAGPLSVKLRGIYQSLESFVTIFRNEWLRPELYQAEEVLGSSRGRKFQAIERLAVRLAGWMEVEGICLRNMTRLESASFLVMNFLAMIQTPLVEYDVLEKVILSLLEEKK